MKTREEFKEFQRKVYLHSEPSVDLNKLAEGEQADCTKHTIRCSIYERLMKEFCEGNSEYVCACNMWLMMSGPRIINDEEEQQ